MSALSAGQPNAPATTATTTTDDNRFVSPDDKLAPFNPTDVSAQKLAFEALKLLPSDVVYDLGCGDGRFLTYVCDNMGGGEGCARCVGVEYDKIYADR